MAVSAVVPRLQPANPVVVGSASRVRTPGRATALRVAASAESGGAATTESKERKRPGENKGFVEEMRFVAMKLHTRDQAKEGEKKPEAEQKPMAQWQPTKEGYLKFLVESKAVYEAMEQIVASESSPIYAEFLNTGLERTEALTEDIAWFAEQGMEVPPADGPGAEYGEFLKELSETSPPEFICHFYNVYFAHSAGGRMIGRKVSEMILNGKNLAFYKWDKNGGLDESLSAVKQKLNEVANGWTREEKDRCLEETSKSFQLSGKLLRLIAG